MNLPKQLRHKKNKERKLLVKSGFTRRPSLIGRGGETPLLLVFFILENSFFNVKLMNMK